MTSLDIVKRLREQPFRPFEVVMNNGDRFPVRHPEFLVVHPTSMRWYPVIERDGVLVADYDSAMLSIRNVASLDPLAEQAA